MVCDTPPSQDASTHQIWNSYLKEYRRFVPDSMRVLETRSEVKIKVTVTQISFATRRHPMIHPHTKFGIPTSNYTSDMLQTRFLFKHRSEVKVTVTRKWNTTLCRTHQIWDSYLKEYRRYAPDTKWDGRTD